MSELVRLDHNIRPTRSSSTIRLKIEKAYSLLSQKMMRQPTYQEIAEYLEIPEYVIYDSMNLVNTSSFDDIVSDDIRYEEVIGKCDDIDSLLMLKESLNNLDEEEQKIIINRFINGYNQSETSNIIGISQAQVSRKEKRVAEKIKLKVMA
jgi:RNA polymerase sporulation-specific sigma factor